MSTNNYCKGNEISHKVGAFYEHKKSAEAKKS